MCIATHSYQVYHVVHLEYTQLLFNNLLKIKNKLAEVSHISQYKKTKLLNFFSKRRKCAWPQLYKEFLVKTLKCDTSDNKLLKLFLSKMYKLNEKI
jgi:hypothetical protein